MDLPVEVIQHIFSFLSACEIVRLRQVPKKFWDITHNSALWKYIYANSRFLLPPGPYSWQSTQYLERTVVQSELVSKTWTSQPLKELSHTLTSWKQMQHISWTVVFGRWCIYLREKTIQCHDIDTDTHYPLYDGTAHPEFRFMAGTATSTNSKQVYLLLDDCYYPHELIKLLEFRVDNDCFSVPEIIDWAHIGSQSFDMWPSTADFHGSTPFLIVRCYNPCVVFDLHTRCFYRTLAPNSPSNPGIDSQTRPILKLPRYWYKTFSQVVLTRTHVIAIQMSRCSSDMPHVLVQAFVVPKLAIPLDRTVVGELRLTHQVAIPTDFPTFSLLRNSTVDPVTGSVNIRLLHITTTIQNVVGHRNMLCLDLTLPKPVSTTDVLEISVRSQHLFESGSTFVRYTASGDGYARGLLVTNQGPPSFRDTSARKFSIDASGEECTIAISDSCPIDLPGISDDVAFDGATGRVHYFQVANYVNQVVTVALA
ncbi:hypothetical protein OG21DRAFT_1095706 [Imleria badia]|nr:hypothetical protein OG21DRAFT_1095706 [Imleria badia]